MVSTNSLSLRLLLHLFSCSSQPGRRTYPLLAFTVRFELAETSPRYDFPVRDLILLLIILAVKDRKVRANIELEFQKKIELGARKKPPLPLESRLAKTCGCLKGCNRL